MARVCAGLVGVDADNGRYGVQSVTGCATPVSGGDGYGSTAPVYG
jgi:hypothetical protein